MMILENIRKKCISLWFGRHLIERLCNQFYGFAEVISPVCIALSKSGKRERKNILGFSAGKCETMEIKQESSRRGVGSEVTFIYFTELVS